MNIILVHGAWADGSMWTKVIPILQDAGHRVIAVHLPFHSLADDVATVKRAIELVGRPTIVVGHSYGGMVITNAAYNNLLKSLVLLRGSIFQHGIKYQRMTRAFLLMYNVRSQNKWMPLLYHFHQAMLHLCLIQVRLPN